jgi:hypothetical protein
MVRWGTVAKGWGSPCLRQGWPGWDYWIKEIREQEAGYVARVEQAYERVVAAWKENQKVATN